MPKGPAHFLNRMHAVGSNKFLSVECLLRASHYRHDFMVFKQTASKVHTQSCFSHEDPELSKISFMLKRAQGRERMSMFLEGAPSLGEGQGQRHLGGRGREVCPAAWLSGRCASDGSSFALGFMRVLCLLT